MDSACFNRVHAVHTGFIFNKRAHLFGMVDIAVVQNEDTSRAWIGIRKGNLQYTLCQIYCMFQANV